MNQQCQIPEINTTTGEITDILKTTRSIAVIGLSDKPEKPSFRVAAYLKKKGYRIFPVNPSLEEVLGEKAYAELDEISEKIDLVNIFRRPEHVPEIVNQAIKKGARAIWMQEGIVHNKAAQKAIDAGLRVVMDKCMMKEHTAAFNSNTDNIYEPTIPDGLVQGMTNFSIDFDSLSIEEENLPDSSITYDLLILGGGPAAMTASVYAARKLMKVCILTKDFGGQMGWTSEIENYMGFQVITGKELVRMFLDQVKHFQVPIRQESNIKEVKKENGVFRVVLEDSAVFQGKTAILATGKRDRPLDVPGEKELIGKGVAYCATCDAPFFKDKIVFVAGGGNSAFTAANDLLKVAKRITLVNYAKDWQADPIMVDAVKGNEKLRMFDNQQITGIVGSDNVTGIKVKDRASGEENTYEADGIFIEIGLLPNSDPVRNLAELNQSGEVIVDCHCRTNVEGLFGAGDVTTVPHKQIIISAGEGAKAALSAHEYLTRLGTL